MPVPYRGGAWRASQRPLDGIRAGCDRLRVSAGTKLLEKMRANPRDWRIEDVERVCQAYGVACTPPRKGSHYKVNHPSQQAILTIPAHRPIKPVYIKDLMTFLDSVIEAGR